MDQFFKTVENLQIDFKSQQQIGIIVAVSVLLITLVITWLLRRSPSNKNLVLILGVSNSGKTTLFSQLVHKKQLFTQTSITQNSGTAVISKTDSAKEKRVDLVDIPGNDKVRRKFLDTYKKNAKALIFVVDSSTLQKDLKDVATYLYDILTDDQLSKSKLKLLIVSNKQDIEFAKGESVVKTSLEKEIELLRKISSSALKSTNEGKKSNHLALHSGTEAAFNFADLKYFKCDFEESSFHDHAWINKSVVSWIQNKL